MLNTLQVRAYTTLNELSAIRSDWEQLLSIYPQATTFCSWEWLSCWWQSFGAQRHLWVLGVYDASTLIGLAPLTIAKERFAKFLTLRVVRIMGDGSADSDNLDLPVRPGFEGPFAESLLNYLRREKARWDICLMNTLPTGSSFLKAAKKQESLPRWISFQNSTLSCAIQLPASWDDYVSRLSSEDQKNLPRYLRRLRKRYATRIYRCTDPRDLPRCLGALFQLHQDRWQKDGQKGSFASEERRDFYVRLSQCLLDRRTLELWILELDGEIGAVQFAFRFRDRVFQLQEGYNPARASDRLGYVLRGEVLKQLISEGARVYDFLGGDDGYKARWGATPGEYRELHFARMFSLGGALLCFSESVTRGKRWLRTKLPQRVWGILRNTRRWVKARFARKSDLQRGVHPLDSCDLIAREGSHNLNRFSLGTDTPRQTPAQNIEVG